MGSSETGAALPLLRVNARHAGVARSALTKAYAGVCRFVRGRGEKIRRRATMVEFMRHYCGAEEALGALGWAAARARISRMVRRPCSAICGVAPADRRA